ncbi:hypothetical protein IID10_08205 [candidate division KSB1 bacterium]|nr:hypothetical protein [candidate division KSB1 bacterium]
MECLRTRIGRFALHHHGGFLRPPHEAQYFSGRRSLTIHSGQGGGLGLSIRCPARGGAAVVFASDRLDNLSSI